MTRGKKERESTSNVVAKIHTDGRVEEVNRPMTLKEMQEFVGGYIEMVSCNLPHRALIVNEDGLGLDLQRNVKASEYVAEGVMVLDFIRGNALLIKWM